MENLDDEIEQIIENAVGELYRGFYRLRRSGQYIQWSGKYLYSDKPFRIEDPTIVILSK